MLQAQQKLELAQQYLQSAEMQKQEVKRLSNEILSQSRQEADQFVNQTQSKAVLEAKHIYNNAIMQAQKITEDAKEAVHKNITEIAFDVASKIIGENVDSAKNRQMVDDYIKSLGTS